MGGRAIWPYYYAGTMGLRDEATASTACATPRNTPASTRRSAPPSAWTGFIAGTGQAGRARSARDGQVRLRRDLGHQRRCTPRSTSCTHAMQGPEGRAAPRSSRSTSTDNADASNQADLALVLRPGTDAALACAVMHILFRDGHRRPRRIIAQLHRLHRASSRSISASRTPEWAAAITGLERRARSRNSPRLVGTRRKRSYLPARLRLRPPAATAPSTMHAAL